MLSDVDVLTFLCFPSILQRSSIHTLNYWDLKNSKILHSCAHNCKSGLMRYDLYIVKFTSFRFISKTRSRMKSRPGKASGRYPPNNSQFW